MTNSIGSYCSSSITGCNTRRYHSLLVAATNPPVGRIATLSLMMEQLAVNGKTFNLACHEFDGAFSPSSSQHLREFNPLPLPTYIFSCDGVRLTKELALADNANAICVRYTLAGGDGQVKVSPFLAMRDFHHLRLAKDSGKSEQQVFSSKPTPQGVMITSCDSDGLAIHLSSKVARYQPDEKWWYQFLYRMELARGQDCFEDLYCPGDFLIDLSDGQSFQITASIGASGSVDFNDALAKRNDKIKQASSLLGEDTTDEIHRLTLAADDFIVERRIGDHPPSATILAGYHWFADWGRDTFISLPGLLLCTGKIDLARQVFESFARSIDAGMVPNRFDDYTDNPHYNSIDASLWFIIAAERFLEATGDREFWRSVLAPAAMAIIEGYQRGTRFDIHAEPTGLLAGGSPTTQLTWMDAALGDEVITPRHGLAVEINALWYNCHKILAQRLAEDGDKRAEYYSTQADKIAAAFDETFWYESGGYLYDCISTDSGLASLAIRPNQIFAVSLPHSPLSTKKQHAVFNIVKKHLLTPMGLRTLSPSDASYRRQYTGSFESRDRAYHQGTVWAWLIGPFVEAYLKLHHDRLRAGEIAKRYLTALDHHLDDAGIGQISEIFDGDFPHHPRGSIAQAWSVAELLRAKFLIIKHQHGHR